jgi:hypothetical protein
LGKVSGSGLKDGRRKGDLLKTFMGSKSTIIFFPLFLHCLRLFVLYRFHHRYFLALCGVVGKDKGLVHLPAGLCWFGLLWQKIVSGIATKKQRISIQALDFVFGADIISY